MTNRLIEQLNGFDTPIHLNETVLEIENKKKALSSQLLKEVTCLKLLSSLWVAVPFKPRPLELEGVEGYENIHYHVSNIQQYAGKKVTILGGGLGC